MKAVILAAGEGNRMRPLTYTRPKVMLPIANKPILEHLLLEAKKAGIEEFILVTGYHDEQVRDYFGNGAKWGLNIAYCTQRRQLGTADALKMVKSLVEGNFLLINGDIIVSGEDIQKLAKKSANTISIVEVKDTRDLGIVAVKQNRVVNIYEKTEKPPSRLANAGLYLFTPDIFQAVVHTEKSPRGEYEITASLQLLIDRGQPILVQKIGYWLDLSYPWDLLPANEFLLSTIRAQNRGEIEANVTIKGTVAIGADSIIRSGSYLVGPIVIGAGCDLGPGCYIRPHSAIGDNCHIGYGVEIKNSIIMADTKIPHLSYVGDSIIGQECNLGAGTKIANLRLDKRDIIVSGVATQRRKLGAIIGDQVETGINVSLNVGSIIGNNTHLGPGVTVSGVIAPYSKIL